MVTVIGKAPAVCNSDAGMVAVISVPFTTPVISTRPLKRTSIGVLRALRKFVPVIRTSRAGLFTVAAVGWMAVIAAVTRAGEVMGKSTAAESGPPTPLRTVTGLLPTLRR